MYIKQILRVLSGWIRILGGKTDCSPDKQQTGPEMSKLYTINDFLFATQNDNINLFKVLFVHELLNSSRDFLNFGESLIHPA